MPAATDAPADVLGRVTLVTGPEEFLGERVVGRARATVKAADAEAEFSETTADLLSAATLGELSAPSLFSATRCVVVRRLEDLPDESGDGILHYAANPVEDVALVLVHSGGSKGSGLLTKLRKLASVSEHRSTAMRPSELPGFVAAELRGHRVRIDADAASFLVTAVGQDTRALAAAAGQLAADFEGQPVTIDMVRTYFGGRAEAKSFAVADLTLEGRAAPALDELRWALDRGTAPVLVTSAMAAGVRALAKYQGAGRGGGDQAMAALVGVPPWKLRTIRAQSQGWDSAGLSRAVQEVARVDADIKGRAHDAAYALERMVLTIARLRRR